MKTETQQRIDGSGLFFFKSDLTTNKKIEILDWYDSLSDKQRDYVEILRSERADDVQFFTSCE